MTHDSVSRMSRVHVGTCLAGLEHRCEVSLFPTFSCWRRSENLLKRLRSCVGMSKLLERFLLFLATMASSQFQAARRLRKNAVLRGTATTGAEAHADSTCFTRPWKGRSSTVMHTFVVFPQPPRSWEQFFAFGLHFNALRRACKAYIASSTACSSSILSPAE